MTRGIFLIECHKHDDSVLFWWMYGKCVCMCVLYPKHENTHTPRHRAALGWRRLWPPMFDPLSCRTREMMCRDVVQCVVTLSEVVLVMMPRVLWGGKSALVAAAWTLQRDEMLRKINASTIVRTIWNLIHILRRHQNDAWPPGYSRGQRRYILPSSWSNTPLKSDAKIWFKRPRVLWFINNNIVLNNGRWSL